MSLLVDSRGNPLVADPIGPMYGPVRFEEQPAYVRRRGRKGKALSWRRKAARTSSGGRRRRSYGAARLSSRRSTKASRRANRKDYRRYRAVQAGTYGPVRFEDQPRWVRKRGRKSLNKGRSRNRTAWRASSRRTRRGSSKRGMTRRERKRINRAKYRAAQSRGGSRSSSRRASRGSSRRSSRGGASRRLSYGSIMKQLRGTKDKAWVCAGPRRSGCGGGRKGKRGSRVVAILRG